MKNEKQYARHRVHQIANAKVAALRVKYQKPGKQLTGEQRIDLIRSGKVKLFPDARWHGYDNVTALFDFAKYEFDESFDPKFEKEAAVVMQRAGDIEDEIMLGDNEEALQMIREFQKDMKN